MFACNVGVYKISSSSCVDNIDSLWLSHPTLLLLAGPIDGIQ